MRARDVTLRDRDFLDPVLGSPFMIELMARDREQWQQFGNEIVTAFLAGKDAARAQPEP